MNLPEASADKIGLIRVSPRPEHPPLSLMQQRLWILEQMLEGRTAYHSAIALSLRGPLDIDAMILALNSLSQRHEVLRTSFPSLDDEPWQQIAPQTKLNVRRVDLRHLTAPDRLQRARDVLNEEQLQPYDIAQGPLVRYMLVQLGQEENILAIVMHHLISDAGSNSVICRELGLLYSAATQGNDLDLEPLEIQYADYALWQHAMAASGEWDEQLRFWRQHLRDAADTVGLPTARERSAELVEAGYQGGIFEFIIDDTLTGRILRIARETTATPFMAFFTAFGIALGRAYDDQGGDVVIGVPFDGRFDRRLSELVGMFVNTLAVRVRCTPDDSYRDVLCRTRDSLIGAYSNSDIPFDRVVKELAPTRDPRFNPLFQVMFQLQHGQGDPIDMSGLEVTRARTSARQPVKFELMLNASLIDGALDCEISFASELFPRWAIEQFAQAFQQLLSAFAAYPDSPLGALRSHLATTDNPCVNTDRSLPEEPGNSANSSFESLLCSVFKEILGRSEMAIDDDFFFLGGDSLMAIKAIHRFNRLAQVKIPVMAIFSHPTAARLAAVVANESKA